MVKTRFAPSPTGFLHVGGLRTALFSYLLAKSQGGKFLLRIEDTDQGRFVEGAIENMLQALAWAGIGPDEGVTLDETGKVSQSGENGPYIQSQRLDVYKKYVQELLEKGQAYYCFCTKERLDELRKMQELNKQVTGYDGFCRELDFSESQKRVANGEASVVRMKMPREGVTQCVDLIRGTVEFQNALVDDQVILKSDGFPTYHLAVVVDDHHMEITHVIRGEEWLSSTPKHIVLYNLFGWQPPQFAHLPLLVNAQRQKLSKRHGDVAVEDFREKGYLAEAMVNFVAFLGWNPGDEREMFTLEELISEFKLDRASKSAAVFNEEKLMWYNKEYMKAMPIAELTKRAVPFFLNAGVFRSAQEVDMAMLEKIVAIERERASTLKEIPAEVGFFFASEIKYESEILIWKKDTREGSKEKLTQLLPVLQNISEENWNKEALEQTVQSWIKENNFGVGDILWPMRVSLSGQKNSPGPFEIADVLGKQKTLKRIQTAIDQL